MKDLVYPYTLFPFSVQKYLNNDFDYPYVSSKPVEPKRRDKIKKDSYAVAFVGVMTFLISVIIQLPLLLVFSAFIIIISLLLGASENRREALNNKIFNDQMFYYNNQLYKYRTEIRLKNDFIKSLKSDEFRAEYRIEKIKYFFSTMNFEIEDSISVQGYSEKYFSEMLASIFKECTILTEKTLNKYTKNPFSPDIILYDPNFNIYVDIEIDEPYAFNDKTPIHYLQQIESNEFVHINMKRDDYFTGIGVIVIRFSEQQILETALGCVKYISNIMYRLTNSHYYLKLMDNYVVKEVLSQEFWSLEDSNDLINIKFRESYYFDSNGFQKNISERFKIRYKEEEVKCEQNYLNNSSYYDEDDDLPF